MWFIPKGIGTIWQNRKVFKKHNVIPKLIYPAQQSLLKVAISLIKGRKYKYLFRKCIVWNCLRINFCLIRFGYTFQKIYCFILVFQKSVSVLESHCKMSSILEQIEKQKSAPLNVALRLTEVMNQFLSWDISRKDNFL